MTDKLSITFKETAFKHGIKKEDILFAMANPIIDNMFEPFPEKYLAIGFSRSGNLLEIMYNLENDTKLNVFHAMRCRKNYIKLLNFNFGGEI